MSVIRILLIVFTLALAGLSLFTLIGCSCENEASAGDSREEYLAERAAKLAAERHVRNEERQRWNKDLKKLLNAPLTREGVFIVEPVDVPSSPKRRRVRRFQWESPAETRGKLWNVPEEESEEATLTAFLRVCIAEADGNTEDCIGIWQVVKNNRRRSCDREMVRRITECVEGEGETMLSALRRHQRHVLGYIKARNTRAVWIGQMTLDCESPPEAFLVGQSETDRMNAWDAQYQERCSQAVADARYLIKGKLPPSRPGHQVSWLPGHPITWGGRCESGKAACDDRIACSRGLARIPTVGTSNAFWCRPGAPGCRTDPEPICQQLGYATVIEQTPIAAAEEAVIASGG